MPFTLRPTEEQDKKLEKLTKVTGQSTKAKAIFEMVENYEQYKKSHETLLSIRNNEFKIQELEEERKELLERY